MTLTLSLPASQASTSQSPPHHHQPTHSNRSGNNPTVSQPIQESGLRRSSRQSDSSQRTAITTQRHNRHTTCNLNPASYLSWDGCYVIDFFVVGETVGCCEAISTASSWIYLFIELALYENREVFEGIGLFRDDEGLVE